MRIPVDALGRMKLLEAGNVRALKFLQVEVRQHGYSSGPPWPSRCSTH